MATSSTWTISTTNGFVPQQSATPPTGSLCPQLWTSFFRKKSLSQTFHSSSRFWLISKMRKKGAPTNVLMREQTCSCLKLRKKRKKDELQPSWRDNIKRVSKSDCSNFLLTFYLNIDIGLWKIRDKYRTYYR